MIPTLSHDRMTAMILENKVRLHIHESRQIDGVFGKKAITEESRLEIAKGKIGHPYTVTCANGHPWEDSTTYVNPNTGDRCCKICVAAKKKMRKG
jgi:hypothetical protein